MSIWGLDKKAMSSYTCGDLHAFYETLGTVRIKEDDLFPDIRRRLQNKFNWIDYRPQY